MALKQVSSTKPRSARGVKVAEPISGVPSDPSLCASGVAVIETEARALASLAARVGHSFADACRLMLQCRGRVVVTGMGKSGHVGRKISATLASAGTPSFFMHPGEASHGDLGMITGDDVVLAISNSGGTSEIVTILPLIKRRGVPLITLTGDGQSRMAEVADVNIDVGVEEEACPLGLAPTASTTATLAMGDALAIALLEARGFSAEDFARSHPGGRLGRRLLLHVSDIMHTGDDMPTVALDVPVSQALMEMTRTGLGTAAIVDAELKVLGIYTDGDLRRTLDREVDVHKAKISEVMTAECITVAPNMLAAEGLKIMEDREINSLLVVDTEHRLVGVLVMHDLLRAGVI
ncbi:MAG: KpsF/GutQ family sugar-phosphate isomerase [Gammaproteobacteria bacterium]|nr:KpsF/GutQ family sugar-phosphate isomerase [Gammaproteobacteria bacterium]